MCYSSTWIVYWWRIICLILLTTTIIGWNWLHRWLNNCWLLIVLTSLRWFTLIVIFKWIIFLKTSLCIICISCNLLYGWILLCYSFLCCLIITVSRMTNKKKRNVNLPQMDYLLHQKDYHQNQTFCSNYFITKSLNNSLFIKFYIIRSLLQF